MAKEFSWDRFWNRPIVGILRGFPIEAVEQILPRCLAGGLANVEVTMNSPEPAAQIRKCCELVGDQMNVGAGTVCSLEDLEAALSAGAQFIITPAMLPEVITECKKRSIPIFPGAYTPTEIFTAWELGADIVKVFPASGLGPSYFKGVLGPFPQIKLMPTGGVSVESLADFHAAGACAFSVGSTLFDSERIAAEDWQWIEAQTKRFIDAYAATQG